MHGGVFHLLLELCYYG